MTASILCSSQSTSAQDGGLLDDLSKQLEQTTKPQNPPAANGQTPSNGQNALAGSELPGSELVQVNALMAQAAARLQAGQTDAPTHQFQQQAIDLLDQLLAQINRQQQSSSAQQRESESSASETMSAEERAQQLQASQPAGEGDQSQGNRPEGESQQGEQGQQNGAPDGGSRGAASGGNTPTGVAGPGSDRPIPEAPPLQALSQGVWGHLPERTRRELQAVNPEQYVPAYRRQIEAYYRRLAEQKRSNSSGGGK